MNASVAIQVLPKVKEEKNVIPVVDKVIEYIKSTGVTYYVGPFETTMEGEYDELMDIVKNCQKIAISSGAESVSSYIKIVYKPEGGIYTIEEKTSKHHK